MNDICHICDKPFGGSEHRFLHMIKHIQDGTAIGTLDANRGRWWFEKVDVGAAPSGRPQEGEKA